MAGILIQQQGDLPASISIMKMVKKRLEVHSFVVFPGQKQPITRTQIDDSKNHPLGIAAGNRDRRWKTSLRPSRRKRWKEAKICFVLGQNNAAGWQHVDLAQNLPFFSLCPGRPSTRSENASIRSLNDVTGGEVYSRRQSSRSYEKGIPEEARSSIRSLDIQDLGVTSLKRNSKSPHPSLSTGWVDLDRADEATPSGFDNLDSAQSNRRESVGQSEEVEWSEPIGSPWSTANNANVRRYT